MNISARCREHSADEVKKYVDSCKIFVVIFSVHIFLQEWLMIGTLL